MSLLAFFLFFLALPSFAGSSSSSDREVDHLIAQGRAVALAAEAKLRDKPRLSSNLPYACQGRLTVQSGTPVPITDQANATTLYFTPYLGGRVGLYNGTTWIIDSFTEQSLPLSGLSANTNYDVFLYDSLGVPTMELTAWSSNTARGTNLTTQDGVYVKTAATTRRYIGTIRVTSATQTQDTAAKRFVWNYYNRVWRHLQFQEATASWTYATTAYRAANNTATNLVEYVSGLVESIVPMVTLLAMSSSAQVTNVGNATNLDATNAATAGVLRGGASDTLIRRPSASAGFEYESLGYHAVQWVESGNAGATTTFASAPDSKMQGGMLGMIRN